MSPKENWQECQQPHETIDKKIKELLQKGSYQSAADSIGVDKAQLFRFYDKHVSRGERVATHNKVLDAINMRCRWTGTTYVVEERIA